MKEFLRKHGANAVLPRELRKIPPAILILCPSNVLEQTVCEAERLIMDEHMHIIYYYGDGRSAPKFTPRKLHSVLDKTGNNRDLEQDDFFFTRHVLAKEGRWVIISTPDTWRRRHGPIALKRWRMANGMTEKQAESMLAVPDPSWPGHLDKHIGTIIVDEATCIGNPHNGISVALHWLESAFIVLVSATPITTHIGNFLGWVSLVFDRKQSSGLIQPKTNRKPVNPWKYLKKNPDDPNWEKNPMVGNTRYVPETFLRHVIRYAIANAVDAGYRLRTVIKDILLARSYDSTLPRGDPRSRIGSQIPSRDSFQVSLKFGELAKELYKKFAPPHLAKLFGGAGVQAGATTTDVPKQNKHLLNSGAKRALILLSFCPLFGFLPRLMNVGLEKQINKTILRLSDEEFLQLIGTWLWENTEPKDVRRFRPKGFTKDDAKRPLQVVRWIVAYSPRLAFVLQFAGVHVALHQRKLCTWVYYPIEQKLLQAIFTTIGIPATGFMAHMSPSERRAIQEEFNSHNSVLMVLCNSFQVSLQGLNLQRSCFQAIFVDPPQNLSEKEQAEGRQWRLGQQYICRFFTLFTKNTFSDTIVQKCLVRALPTFIAYANLEHFDASNTDIREAFSVFWLIEGKVVIAGKHNAPSQEELIAAEKSANTIKEHDPRSEVCTIRRMEPHEVTHWLLRQLQGTMIGDTSPDDDDAMDVDDDEAAVVNSALALGDEWYVRLQADLVGLGEEEERLKETADDDEGDDELLEDTEGPAPTLQDFLDEDDEYHAGTLHTVLKGLHYRLAADDSDEHMRDSNSNRSDTPEPEPYQGDPEDYNSEVGPSDAQIDAMDEEQMERMFTRTGRWERRHRRAFRFERGLPLDPDDCSTDPDGVEDDDEITTDDEAVDGEDEDDNGSDMDTGEE
jgi:hypothetical protein